jgi:hypothetical protein
MMLFSIESRTTSDLVLSILESENQSALLDRLLPFLSLFCVVEIIMKDVSTVEYKPQHLWEWAQNAMEEVQKVA